jgi:hypothetical protein
METSIDVFELAALGANPSRDILLSASDSVPASLLVSSE